MLHAVITCTSEHICLFPHDIILPENVTLFHIASLFKIEITMPESTNKFKSYEIYTMSNKNQELKIF
jgi:hypothetical protein